MGNTETNKVDCGEALDMSTVAALHEEIRKSLGESANGSTLVLELAEVGKFDTAGLQLLCATASAATALGIALRFNGASSELDEAVKVLDLVAQLEGWTNGAAENAEKTSA